MGELTLLIVVAFLGGWAFKGIINRRNSNIQQLGEPEMMWFNEQTSQWERVTELRLLVADRVVVAIPVKLVVQSDDIR